MADKIEVQNIGLKEALRRLRKDEDSMATMSNYTLRLLASLKAEAEKVAEEEGTTLNQFINVAVAEKLAASADGSLLSGTRHTR